MKLYHAGILGAGHHTPQSHYVVAESYDAAMALAERVGTVQRLNEVGVPLTVQPVQAAGRLAREQAAADLLMLALTERIEALEAKVDGLLRIRVWDIVANGLAQVRR